MNRNVGLKVADYHSVSAVDGTRPTFSQMEKPQGIRNSQFSGNRLLGSCCLPPHTGEHLNLCRNWMYIELDSGWGVDRLDVS